MFADSGRCLSIKNEDEKLTTFTITVGAVKKPPNFAALTPAVRTIIVYDEVVVPRSYTRSIMSQLGTAIKFHDGIEKIRFVECDMQEARFGPLLDAMAERPFHYGPGIVFDFEQCTFQLDSVVGKIRQMLENDFLQGISFSGCEFYDDAGKAIQVAIRNSRSLRKFHCFARFASTELLPATIQPVCDMITTNQNIVDLGLALKEDDNIMELRQAVNQYKVLQRLEIRNTIMELCLVQPIVMMCVEVDSFRDLSFKQCTFKTDAIKLLLETLSNVKAIDTLTLDDVAVDANLALTIERLQVQKFSLYRSYFIYDSFLHMFDQLAINPLIQSLDLRGVIAMHEQFRALCDVVLRQNMGPSELCIDSFNSETTLMLTEAMQQNTSVGRLMVTFSNNNSDLVTFIQGLANMNGLRKLSLYFIQEGASCEDILRPLAHSLEQNTTLCKLSLDGLNPNQAIAQRYLPRIRYLLATNMVGRHSLIASPHVPAGLWARVLANACHEVDAIYFALTEHPDLIS